MVDNINGPSNVALHLEKVTGNQSGASNITPRKDAVIDVKTPEVRITEVANAVASEKRDSLDSLNEAAAELRDAINTLNSALEKTPTKAIITRDEELNRFIVRIADQASGEIVKEIPSEALLKFARNLQELKGLIFDASL